MGPSNHSSYHLSIYSSFIDLSLSMHTLIHPTIPSNSPFFHLSIYPFIQSSIHSTNICWSLLKGLLWPQAMGCHFFPFEYVDMVGLASLLMLISLAHTCRHRLCLHRDCVPPECILHHHLGLGHILPVPVFPVGAALGALQPHLEHTLLLGGHYAQE